MRIGRVRDKRTGQVHRVIFVGDVAHHMEGELSSDARIGTPVDEFETVETLPPILPGKIVCVGLNYLAHVTENDPNRQVPDEPVIFMKPTSALLGHQGVIQIAHPDHRTDYEAELAVVIGKAARNVEPGQALDYVLGYSCANDVSDRVLQKKDGQWIRAKGFETYCPLGPWIETEVDLDTVVVSSALNGEPRQSQAVSSMIFPVPVLISFISKVMTLDPDDVILTGTPEGVGPMQFGDTIDVTVSGVGTLTNSVVA